VLSPNEGDGGFSDGNLHQRKRGGLKELFVRQNTSWMKDSREKDAGLSSCQKVPRKDGNNPK